MGQVDYHYLNLGQEVLEHKYQPKLLLNHYIYHQNLLYKKLNINIFYLKNLYIINNYVYIYISCNRLINLPKLVDAIRSEINRNQNFTC